MRMEQDGIDNAYKKKNKHIFYIQFYDGAGNPLPGRSSRQTSRVAAKTWAHEQLREGLITLQKDILFEKFAEHWWEYDLFPYIQGKLARGFEMSPA